MDHQTVILTLAVIFGFLMACGIGANDVANAMGTSVGSKVFTLSQAILVASVFEFLGAFLAGGEVTGTISKGITDPHFFYAQPEIFIYGMLAALLAAATWLIVASFYGWPVSTTHSIVGAIIGFAVITVGPQSVQWSKISLIVASWLVSPILGGIVAFLVFNSIQNLILRTEDPFSNAKKYVPIYVFFMGCGISFITLVNGLKHVGISLNYYQSYGLALIFGGTLFLISKILLNKVKLDKKADESFHFTNVEKIFGIMMIFTACSMAFAHGSNDVANAVGPLAAIVQVLKDPNALNNETIVPAWILFLGGTGIVVGLATYGYRVIETVGKNITELTPSRGFSAEISTALTVVCASGIGLPISTTHTLVGAILGVGFARGIGALNLDVLQKIFLSWVVTVPAGIILTMVLFFIIKTAFA
ncbi:MAG: inorganic phosphate transporter [Gammaproteobacteria bacterium]|nr:inorganic phosphate transporter [Gammaproteobacteria bacterium]